MSEAYLCKFYDFSVVWDIWAWRGTMHQAKSFLGLACLSRILAVIVTFKRVSGEYKAEHKKSIEEIIQYGEWLQRI